MKIIFFSCLLMLSSHVFADEYETNMTVALDGSGDFTSIQQAIDATKTFPWTPITIHIKNGVYKEKVNVYSWNTHLSLVGESQSGTIITFDDHFEKINKGRNSTFHTYTMRVAANDFHAQNLTIINASGPVGQAVALHVEADRASFLNVRMKGFQDTLYLAGEGFRSYFKNCYVEGSVDFIFGAGPALFENCEIKSLTNAYITAASTPKNQDYGLVFNQCKLTAAENVDQVYLGRPWRQFAKTVFLNSSLGAHILPAGWDNWGSQEKELSVFYAEYNNTGAGAKTDKRVPWAKQLTQQQANQYRKESIFKDWQPKL